MELICGRALSRYRQVHRRPDASANGLLDTNGSIQKELAKLEKRGSLSPLAFCALRAFTEADGAHVTRPHMRPSVRPAALRGLNALPAWSYNKQAPQASRQVRDAVLLLLALVSCVLYLKANANTSDFSSINQAPVRGRGFLLRIGMVFWLAYAYQANY